MGRQLRLNLTDKNCRILNKKGEYMKFTLLPTIATTTFLAMMACSNLAMAYGAIAVDDAEGDRAIDAGYGYGTGDTEAEAKADALRECKKVGNDDCQVVVTYKLCGAYASSRKYQGVGKGETEASAKKAALEECGDGCRVVASECDN